MSHPDPTAETLPNPYRFAVSVTFTPSRTSWFIHLHENGEYVQTIALFDTKEEADTHAALILSALHQAVME